MPHDLDELEFLSNASVALAELRPEENLFQFVVQRLAKLAPHSLVIAISYEPRGGTASVCAVAGPEDMQSLARELAGEPLGYELRVDEQARQILSEGRLSRVEGGMHQLTFGAWPVDLARLVEKRLGISAIYGQPFSRQGDFLGAVAFLSRVPTLEHSRLIEVFVRLAAVAIQRRRAEAQLRESERRFRMLAENSRDAVFRLRLRPKLKIEYVSRAAADLCGYAIEELYADARLGAPCLYPEEWTADGALRELPAEPVVAQCRRRDGTYVWTEQSFTACRDTSGHIAVVEGITRDITKRKQAQEAAIESDRRKTEFLAVLSHELRNPLGAIRNAVHVLGRAEPGSEPANRARAVVERQIQQLTRLIDDLLDMTRITRGKIRLQRERLELNQIVATTVEDHRSMFARNQVDILVVAAPDEVIVHADRTRVCQIIDNLLQNAAKFTPKGGRATVSVHTDPERNEAVLKVHNTGAPIPPEVLAHLFEPFVQADRTLDRSKGGLGLGLALVQGLVEMHNGSVDVGSSDIAGTTFTIRLPLETTKPKVVRPTEPAQAAPRRVLVIEDNADAAESLRDVLELYQNTVVVASSGPEGIAAARTLKPDIVFCDIGLPEMNGYEVARAIRADPELRKLALVALSGYASREDVARAQEAGFDRHVAKPLSIETLERVMSEVTGGARG